MSKLQTIKSNLSDLEAAAKDLTRYKPRQWADVQMCRMIMAWLVKRSVKKENHA